MGLSEDVYRMLEGIVGVGNISDRPHILAAYRHISPQGGRKSLSPEAVVMPGSTEEVQAIVRACNQNNVRYTAIVSLFGLGWLVSEPGTIIISLRRMNRILEINEKDGYAVIEPAVRHVQLKPEVMKRGLSYPVPSVGPSCSVMANFLGKGEHHIQHSYSKNNRYLMGYEWITPTGEAVRVGSLANDGGWFCSDGPGPSLGGLIQRGNGIYTKAAIALDAWKGPSVMPTEGHSPTYEVRLPKACHKVYIFKFPTLNEVRDFMIEMGKAEIAVGVLKFFYATAAVMFTVSANDFWNLWNSGLFQKELPNAVWVYLATWTPEEMKYEENIMWDIVRELNGEEVNEAIKKIWEDNMDFFVIVSFLQRVLKLGGGWAPIIHTDSLNHTIEIAKTIPEFIDELIEKGLIMDAPHNFQIIPIEYGHGAHIELLFFYDRTSPKGHTIPMEVMKKSMETDIKHGHYSPMPASGDRYSGYEVWAARIKEALESVKSHD